MQSTRRGAGVEIDGRSRVIVKDYGNDPVALAALVRQRRGMAVTDAQMAAVRVNTLALVGGADSRVSEVDDLKKVMSSLKLVLIPNATHAVSDERSPPRRAEFVTEIRESIRVQRPARS